MGESELVQQLGRLGDVPVTVRAELDQCTVTLTELMDLRPGELISLGRPTGENIDLYVGEVLVAWGEVRLMDGGLAVRIARLRNHLPGDSGEGGEENPETQPEPEQEPEDEGNE